MAQSAKPAAKKPEDPTVQKKSGKKLVIIAGVALLVIAAGAAGWFFSKGKSGEQHVEEVKVAPPKTPIFVPLEPFTVNLRNEQNGDQYLQLGLSMKVFEMEIEAKIKTSLPEIRSKILQLLTTKTASELLTAEGKTRLVKEIMTMSNTVIGISNLPAPSMPASAPAADPQAASAPVAAPAPIKPAELKGIVDVLFTSFIIQ